jgi:UDPglucose 6-dehydrogenase
VSKDYKIGIVGYGYVGKAVAKLFKEDVKAIYDPNINENFFYPEIGTEKSSFHDLDMVVICVPTDEGRDGRADTSILEETIDWVFRFNPEGIILIKSTTPPATLKFLQDRFQNIVFSPEFIGESKYYTPFWKYPHPTNLEMHTWQVFGGFKRVTSKCVDIFKRRMSVDTQYWQTDIVTASLAKYIENSFFAMKVTFVNEWCDIAEKLNVDWNELREWWLLDPRINRNHTLVFPKDRGYGGKCFPKDTRAIIKQMVDLGYEPELMIAMDKVNKKMRMKNEEE